MNDGARHKLIELVKTSGRSVCQDISRCEALIKDHCAAYKREAFVLVAALKEGAVSDLISADGNISTRLFLPKLAKRLEDNLSLSDDAAEWAVESWAYALGLFDTQGQLTPSGRDKVKTADPQSVYREYVTLILDAGGDLEAVRAKLDDYSNRLGLSLKQAHDIESKCKQGKKAGVARAHRQVQKAKPVNYDELFDFIYEALDTEAEDAEQMAKELAPRLTATGFGLLKDIYEWAQEQEDWGAGEEAMDVAKELATMLTASQFELLKEIHDWLKDEGWDDGYALDIDKELATKLNASQFELLKAIYEWAGEQLCDNEAALDMAKELAPKLSASQFDLFKEHYDRAISDYDKDPEDALSYARKKMRI